MSDTSYKAHINDVSKTSIKCPHCHKSSEEKSKHDIVRMCTIAISTVKLMADGAYKDITKEHIKYMEMYSRNLKNKDKYLHNITSILKILENLRKSGIIEGAQEEGINMTENEEDISIDDIIN